MNIIVWLLPNWLKPHRLQSCIYFLFEKTQRGGVTVTALVLCWGQWRVFGFGVLSLLTTVAWEWGGSHAANMPHLEWRAVAISDMQLMVPWSWVSGEGACVGFETTSIERVSYERSDECSYIFNQHVISSKSEHLFFFFLIGNEPKYFICWNKQMKALAFNKWRNCLGWEFGFNVSH